MDKAQAFIINLKRLDLMDVTENHYTDVVKMKDWLKLDEDQQTILALQTEIQAVKATAQLGRLKNDGKSIKKGEKMQSQEET
jgi:hypothetical protein